MNFSDVASWAVGPAYFKKQDDEQIYVIPSRIAKPLKVVFENSSTIDTWTEVRGGLGNQRLLHWVHDTVCIAGGVPYCCCPSTPQIDISVVEELL